MPRGKKPLGELSARQLKRRLNDDALAILTGLSESESSRGPSALEPGSSSLHMSPDVLSTPFSNSPSKSDLIRVPSESSIVQVLSQSVKSVTKTLPQLQKSKTDLSDLNDFQVNCVTCLLCLCLSCDLCIHTSERCFHCPFCINGEILLSDEDPLSSDDDYDCPESSNIPKAPLKASENAATQLVSWCLKYNIKQDAIRGLLTILRDVYNADLPKDPRTLLQTPASIPCRVCPPGLYWHSGLVKGLRQLKLEDAVDKIELVLSVDGLPLSKSSRSTFWPILCSVNCSQKIILVGAFHGEDKPLDANVYLKDFMEELIPLIANGFEHNGRKLRVELKKIVCDAPARAFILMVKGHMAYFSCSKCVVEGKYVERRVVFLDMNAKLRTDSDFRSQKNEEYHKGETILLQIPQFNIIDQVPLDYMHVILLGVVRKLLKLLVGGKLGVRLQSGLINEISERLNLCCNFIPADFVRKPRSLSFLALFKAVEYRMILLYLGPVVLIPLMADFKDRYSNFLVLHVAVTILCSKSLLQHYGSAFPNDLLRAFVKGFESLYGKEQISHNVHNLIHISQDANVHGILDNFSAFAFENYLQKVKRTVRKGDRPLQQLAKRYGEAVALSAQNCQKLEYVNIVYSGLQRVRCSLLPGCGAPQYKRVTVNKITVDVSSANRYCGLDDGKIVEVHNIAFNKGLNSMVIIGKYFKKLGDFYDYPLPSSHLGIFKVSDPSRLMYWKIDSVCRKYVRLPYKKDYVVFPLLHTELNNVELSST